MSTPEKTAEILQAFDEIARIFGNPAPKPKPQTEDERRAQDAAERKAELIELDLYLEGRAMDARDDRIVRGYLSGGAA